MFLDILNINPLVLGISDYQIYVARAVLQTSSIKPRVKKYSTVKSPSIIIYSVAMVLSVHTKPKHTSTLSDLPVHEAFSKSSYNPSLGPLDVSSNPLLSSETQPPCKWSTIKLTRTQIHQLFKAFSALLDFRSFPKGLFSSKRLAS